MTKAVDLYHERLLSSPDAGPARDYLRSRGYDGEIVRQFRLGWAPDDWDVLAKYLKASPEVLTTPVSDSSTARAGPRTPSGARSSSRSSTRRASPSPSAAGSCRTPAGSEGGSAPVGPKYKNSQDGPIYSKRRTLYGLNWAKHDVVETGEVIVCEGYTDVIAFFLAGLPRAVATCGTALGEEHFRLLRNFARRVVLAYDADAAGQEGAGRVYEWERHHEVDVAVAALPPGADPADLARNNPEALRAADRRGPTLSRFPGGPGAAIRRPADGRRTGQSSRSGHRRWSPSIPTSSCVTSTSWTSPTAVDSSPMPCAPWPAAWPSGRGPRPETPTDRDRVEPEARPQGAALPGPAHEGPQTRARGADISRPGLEALRLAVHRP